MAMAAAASKATKRNLDELTVDPPILRGVPVLPVFRPATSYRDRWAQRSLRRTGVQGIYDIGGCGRVADPPYG
jgi:hypothetical protein